MWGWQARDPREGIQCWVQITFQIDTREARPLRAELSESAQVLEEGTLRRLQQTGRMVLENGS
jgi:hypothetical protein